MKEPSELIKERTELRELVRVPEATAAPGRYASYGYDGEDEAGRGSGYSRLHDYWRSARKRLWLILGIMLLVTTLASFYMARQPDVYEAQARIQVDLETNSAVLGSMKSNSFVLNTPFQDPTYFNTQIQILSSTGLLGRVVKTLDLEHNQAFLRPQAAQGGSTWENLKRMFGFGQRGDGKERAIERLPSTDSLAPPTPRDNLEEVNHLAPYVENLQSRLSVKQLAETRLIEIRFKHGDPQVATKIINAIADAFVYSNLERKTETSDKAGDFLQKRIAELQSDIRSGEERLINYAKNHQILKLDAGQDTVVDRLAGLNRQLLEAENERKMAEANYRATLEPGAAEAQVELTARQITDNQAKLTELRQRRQQLLIEYTEKYPEVKELDQQIAWLEKQITEARRHASSVITTNLVTRYRQALQREQALRSAFERQRGETLTQNEAAVNYRILQQEIETNKSLLDGLLQRAKENDVLVAGTPNNVHVVDYAPVPKGPVGPRRLQGVALAMLLSFVFGVGLARYLEYLDDTLRTSEDVEKALRLPALAVIPAIGSLTRRRLLPALPGLQKRDTGDVNPELLLNADARSPLAEAYRHLRTSVLLSAAGGAPQTMLITSSQPSEGKTTTAVNTALVLAQTGATVLVIDGDMRRPRIHTIFETDNRRGLSTILASKMDEAEIFNLIEAHEETGLYLLTAGAIPPNPAELLGSEEMRRLMATLKSSFTHIVIDSPPIASFTDSVLISSLVDGVLLVVHGGRASRGIVRRSRQVLQDVGAKIFGIVLNNVTLEPNDYYYKYYYNHYYKSEEEPNEVAS